MEESMTYEEALIKLQALQQQLETGAIGIDQLASTMTEANELMEHCKKRLRLTEEQLQNLQQSES